MKTILLQVSDFDFGTAILTLIFGVVVSIGLFLLLRELFLWYWKVNRIVENQEQQNSLLNQILEQLRERDRINE